MKEVRDMYNEKIIDSDSYIEVYDYQTPVYPRRSKKSEDDPSNCFLDEQLSQKRTFDELSAIEQYDSLKRKSKHYKHMRFEIARLVDLNFDHNTKFLALTFKENIANIAYANGEFEKFIKRLNYSVFKTKKAKLKYLATWEKQLRGAIHYHIILFSFPYIDFNKLSKIWGYGFVKINKIDVDAKENRGRYISKYFDKDLELKDHKKKAFFKSRNLKVPSVTKTMVDETVDTSDYEILHSNTYTLKQPIFSDSQSTNENGLEFTNITVQYHKLKKQTRK
ncbi:rolling circle replication-associated protein [Enterococcus sp. RIT-PI-f]|uniref:rolling circle replication-associated protein n=1 Tax=Enterococcus sp. RIT-PI-f TaxID=1690244 RepID=UPI001F3C6DBE|nr:Rep protein [Enterococcus sp. RIT-PI-f]